MLCSTAMATLSLVVVMGPDSGRSCAVAVGQSRVLGRAIGMGGGTAVVPTGERRRLQVEDQRLLGEHLRNRASPDGAPGRAGARGEEGSFAREPDFDLNDDAVSQTHCMVFVDEAGAYLVDVGSTNGTFVNGVKVMEVELGVGDLLRVGETRFEIRPG